jgi:mannosyl-3-phosphoglycerate phosphatase
MEKKYIIFTDLDGTLLDHYTYSFQEAIPALKVIKEKKIPLVFVSSKTKDEIVNLQRRMDVRSMPFVIENGSGIFIPGQLHSEFPHGEMIELGRPYDEIVKFVKAISIKHGYTIQGYHTISDIKLAELTGLSGGDLKRSRNRLFSLPLLRDAQAEHIISHEIPGSGLKILTGGRFTHLLADTDKGKAVQIIRDKLTDSSWVSIGLGDSPNDLELLKAVDIPVLVRKSDGTYDKSIRLSKMMISRNNGPQGWNDCVLKIVREERSLDG